MMAICMSDRRPMMIWFCSGRPVVAVSHTRGHSHGGGQSDDSTHAEKDHRVCKRRYRLPFVAAVPDPGSSHDDVDLKQQSTEVGGLYQLRFAGMWAEGRTCRP